MARDDDNEPVADHTELDEAAEVLYRVHRRDPESGVELLDGYLQRRARRRAQGPVKPKTTGNEPAGKDESCSEGQPTVDPHPPSVEPEGLETPLKRLGADLVDRLQTRPARGRQQQ